jgi:hypothetical protein
MILADKTELTDGDKTFAIQPGMKVSADIYVGNQPLLTVLQPQIKKIRTVLGKTG